MIPTVEDLSSAPLVHRFGDLFNPPALANRLGSLQAAIDITGIRSINFPPFACSDTFPPASWSDSTTAAMFIDGRYFASTGTPVEFVWRPDRIERRAEISGLEISSQTVVGVDEKVVLIRVRVRNLSGSRRSVGVRFGLKSTVTADHGHWDRAIAAAEADNEAIIDAERRAVLFRARHSDAVSLQGAWPPADGIDTRGIRFDLELASGGEWSCTVANVIDANAEAASAVYDAYVRDADGAIEGAAAEWNAEIAAAFTPGNDRFSGSLPVLETGDEGIRRLFFLGVLAVLYFKRELPHSVVGRVYTTLMPRYWQTLTWLWDTELGSPAHALLDPATLRRCLEHWMSWDTHSFMATDWLTGRGVGHPYSINDHAMVRMCHEYLRWSGDRDWLASKNIGPDGHDHRVVEFLQGYAQGWRRFEKGSGLADYEEMSSLLECVPAYAHEVAGLNAASVFNLRIFADILADTGDLARARAMRDEANTLLNELQKLYVPGAGYWHARRPDGELVPVRHAFDLMKVLNAIPEDLSDSQKSDMTRFFCEELQTPTWMRALSAHDPDALFDIRPDHQWSGAFAAWPAETAAGLCRIGRIDLVVPWLRGIAETGRQGLFGQAHFAEDTIAPDADGARKASSDFPYLTDWACAAGAAWVRVILESLFGIEAPLSGELRATPRVEAFDPDARLVGLRHQDRLYSVDRHGVHPL